MAIKLGSIIGGILVLFLVKISFDTTIAQTDHQATQESLRSPTSIDESYRLEMNSIKR